MFGPESFLLLEGPALPSNSYEYALNLLSARAYTARNLRRKLVQKEFHPAEVDSALERLVASRLIDDIRFAHEYARQKLIAGGSRRRVEQELLKRGIARDTVVEAVGRVIDEEAIDTSAGLAKAAAKKLASLGELDQHVRRRRAFAFLARRGFDLTDIKIVLDRLLADDDQ